MITITLSMFDRSRRALVTLPTSTTVGEVLAQCVQRWALPETTFAVRHVLSDRLLLEAEELSEAGIEDGAELQLFPMLEGGASA